MCYRGSGNFGRGYAIIEYLLEDEKNTLKGAAKEFRIAITTARCDMDRVCRDAADGKCKNPEKTLLMFIKAKKQLKANQNWQ